jgi:hypothetical protein
MTVGSKPLCGGETRKGGKCRRPAGWGTPHQGVGTCKLHAGNTPAAVLKGMVELARREQQVMGMPLSIEPQDAILECIRIAAGEVAYASERISELEASDAVGPVTTRLDRSGPEGAGEEVREGPPALHVWIQVRRQAMDRLVNYSFAALKAGIEERRVRIAEQQGMLLAQAIQGILRELGVSERPEVAGVVRKHLTLVAGESVASDAGA